MKPGNRLNIRNGANSHKVLITFEDERSDVYTMLSLLTQKRKHFLLWSEMES